MTSRALVVLIGAVTVLAPVAPARADGPRQVTYTVITDHPVTADIYYREVDPPTWADYSHNPYLYSPKARVDIGPDRPWVRTVALTDPQRWAMVSATSGREPVEPGFWCQLTVDGVIVGTGDGPKGALCSIRHW